MQWEGDIRFKLVNTKCALGMQAVKSLIYEHGCTVKKKKGNKSYHVSKSFSILPNEISFMEIVS